MEIDLLKLLQSNEILVLFFALGSGYLIGNIKIGVIEVGSTTGVLLTGLFLGHLGLKTNPLIGTLGFTLFIFCVGYQAGPRFFGVLLEDGRKYIAGALTSTPTLVGAEDAISSGLARVPAGMTAEKAAQNISVAYAITYIFGTAGLILFIQYFPSMFGVDLREEARKLARERGIREEGDGAESANEITLPVVRAYRVSVDEFIGKSIKDLPRRRPYTITQIKRGDQMIDPTPDTIVEEGDIIAAVAELEDHMDAQELLGNEVLDPDLIALTIDSCDIIVTNSEMTGIPLSELSLTTQHGCFPKSVYRSQIELAADPKMVLAKGDVLRVSGERGRLQSLAEKMGEVEREVQQTDLLTFAYGITGGVLLGMVVLKLGKVNIGLGSAGGLLLAGILIGYLRSLHPTFGRVPGAARHVLMDLGMMLFMVNVGLRAGGNIVEAFLSVGPAILICGVIVTLLPVIAGYFFGWRILKLNPALLLGSLAGSMTSTPSLNVVTEAAKSPVPALGYAGTYTFANVFLTFAGSILMRF
jgi:putative transport protein